jgi:hypothetical protein
MLLKIGVIVALVKAVQSAIAYQKELNTQHEVVFAGLSG